MYAAMYAAKYAVMYVLQCMCCNVCAAMYAAPTGMYSYVRHPMYAGLLLTSLGLAAITRNETRLALAVGLWFILEKKVCRLVRESKE